jgi:hypothetical protein
MQWHNSGVKMNYEQANRILDRATEGWEFSEFVILKALELTGDYVPSSQMEKSPPMNLLKEQND